MNTQHFLVPIDFSIYSDQALAYAMMLATHLQARLTLLHVIHESSLYLADMGSGLPYAYLQELEAEAQRGLEEHLKRVHDAGLQGDMMTVRGVPFQRIIDTAHDQHVDLIVMGTHGRTGLPHALMGSVAEKVVRLAPCPVLVTRGAASTAVQ
ncbi:MAG TPA: universal stress protein [Candidatus Tectomicrobia bacterium]|jgi:nucleotide-binding universal stress UspA family protein